MILTWQPSGPPPTRPRGPGPGRSRWRCPARRAGRGCPGPAPASAAAPARPRHTPGRSHGHGPKVIVDMARKSSLLLNDLGIGVIWRRTMRRRSCELSEGKRLNLGSYCMNRHFQNAGQRY